LVIEFFLFIFELALVAVGINTETIPYIARIINRIKNNAKPDSPKSIKKQSNINNR